MDKFSKDLLENNKECSAEFINYIGRVSMPYSHYHEHYEILYVCENSRGLIINNKDRYILDNSNIALIKPFILHRTLSGADKKQKRMLVNFSNIFAEEKISFAKSHILNFCRLYDFFCKMLYFKLF